MFAKKQPGQGRAGVSWVPRRKLVAFCSFSTLCSCRNSICLGYWPSLELGDWGRNGPYRQHGNAMTEAAPSSVLAPSSDARSP